MLLLLLEFGRVQRWGREELSRCRVVRAPLSNVVGADHRQDGKGNKADGDQKVAQLLRGPLCLRRAGGRRGSRTRSEVADRQQTQPGEHSPSFALVEVEYMYANFIFKYAACAVRHSESLRPCIVAMSSPYAFRPGGALKLKSSGDEGKYVQCAGATRADQPQEEEEKDQVEHHGVRAVGRKLVRCGAGRARSDAWRGSPPGTQRERYHQGGAALSRGAAQAGMYPWQTAVRAVLTRADGRAGAQRGAQVTQGAGELIQRVPRVAHGSQRHAQDRSGVVATWFYHNTLTCNNTT